LIILVLIKTINTIVLRQYCNHSYILIKNLLTVQTKSVGFASLILAGSYVASAALGLLRDRLLAGNFGAGNELDVYYAAFTVPDLIALILIFGAISAAIIPVFTSYIVTSKEEAWHYALVLLNVFLSFLIAVCLVFIIFAPFFVSLIAPGFSESKKEMTVVLMRIMFLSPIILGTSNIISGILQVFHRFLVTALAPVMYNLGIIIGIVFFTPKLGLAGLAWGVVLGGVMHLLIQIPAFLYSGFRYRPMPGRSMFDIKHPGVLKTLKLMIPRSLGLGASQFNTIIVTAIASTLAAGSIAVFNLANNLGSLLVNAISVSLSTAIFPQMSFAYLKEDKRDFEYKFSWALRQILFLIIPMSILIFILRAQIVRVILGTGRFGWLDTRLTAACLGIFAMGLFAQALIFILSKAFYAAHNTKIPAWISFAAVAFNISASLLLVRLLNASGQFFYFMQNLLRLDGIANISIIGLSLSYSITVILQACLLLYFLYKKYRAFRVKELLHSFYKILIASLVMAVFALAVRHSLVAYNFVKLQTFFGVFLQLALSGLVGVFFYGVTSYFLKSSELNMIKKVFFPK